MIERQDKLIGGVSSGSRELINKSNVLWVGGWYLLDVYIDVYLMFLSSLGAWI